MKRRAWTYFDGYVFREVLPPFGIGLIVYTFVLIANQLLQLPEMFIARGVPLGASLKLLLFILPGMMAFTVPMSVLMGILAGLGRLSSDSEITAFRTLGIGQRRLLRPLLLFAFCGWAVSSGLTLWLTPHANDLWLKTYTRSVLAKVDVKIKPRQFDETILNTVIYAQETGRGGTWRNIFLHLAADPVEPRFLLAKSGRLNFFPEARRAAIELEDVVEQSYSLDDPSLFNHSVIRRVEEEVDVGTLYADFRGPKQVREKDFLELLDGLRVARVDRSRHAVQSAALDLRGVAADSLERTEIGVLARLAERDIRAHQVEIHKRLALPFVCWIFVFLGLPLGVSTRKGGRTSGFTLSLIVILLYYILITAGEQIAMTGRLPAALGMWGGDILLAAAGLVLYLRSAGGIPLFQARRRAAAGPGPASAAGRPAKRRRRKLSPAFPNILDRYVARRYLFIGVLIFLSVIAISVVVTLFDRIGTVYQHQKPLVLFLDYLRHRLPEFAHLALPVTALLAGLLTLGLFSKSNEITAMLAGGISLYRIVVPVLVLGAALGGLSFYLQESVLPRANKAAAEAWDRINDRPIQTYSYLNRRWVASSGRDRLYHYAYFDPARSTFSQLDVIDLDLAAWSFKRHVYAERARLEGGILRLESGWVREFEGPVQTAYRQEKAFDLAVPEGRGLFFRDVKEPDQMTFGELRRYVAEVQGLGFDARRLRVDLSSKVSFPMAAVIMTLIGIPFAFGMGRRGALVGIGVGVALAMAYWVAIGIFRSLGNVGALSVFLGAWGPDLLFGLVGLYFLSRLRT